MYQISCHNNFDRIKIDYEKFYDVITNIGNLVEYIERIQSIQTFKLTSKSKIERLLHTIYDELKINSPDLQFFVFSSMSQT